MKESVDCNLVDDLPKISKLLLFDVEDEVCVVDMLVSIRDFLMMLSLYEEAC